MSEQRLRALEDAWRRDPRAHFARLGEEFRRLGALDRARDILRDGITRWPDHENGRVALARVLADAGAGGEAEVELQQVLERHPEHWAALELLAALRRGRGDTDGALILLATLSRLHPGDDEIVRRIERLDAEIAFRAAPAARSPDERAKVRTGAQPGLRSASPTRRRGGDPFVTETVAELLAVQGDIDGALQMLAQLLMRDPSKKSLVARFVELGGDPSTIPGIERVHGSDDPQPARLVAALRALLDGELGRDDRDRTHGDDGGGGAEPTGSTR